MAVLFKDLKHKNQHVTPLKPEPKPEPALAESPDPNFGKLPNFLSFFDTIAGSGEYMPPDIQNKMAQGLSASEAVMAHVLEEKPQLAEAATQELTEDEKLCNEYIFLYKTLEELGIEKIQKRMEEIKKSLQSIANDTIDDDSVATFTSPLGQMVYSARSKVKKFNDSPTLLNDLVEKFGMEAVQQVVKVGVGPLSKLLSPAEMAKHYTEEIGSRSLKAVLPNEE